MTPDQYSNDERSALAAHWADDAAFKLSQALNAGVFCGTSRDGHDMLDSLHDGLQIIAENLGALTLPYPPPPIPPPIPPSRHLKVVK